MTTRVDTLLREMGIVTPAAPKAIGSYVQHSVAGPFLFISGQLPVENGQLRYAGKLGAEVSMEEGQKAARLCALNVLAQAKDALGGFERIKGVVRLNGLINSAPSFTAHGQVMNGASDLIQALFGEPAGRHTRVAIGVASLPLGAAVEVDAIFHVS